MIWELADQNHDGSLSREEFIIAMYLINAKLMGKISAIPDRLQPELIVANLPKTPAGGSSAPSLPSRGGPAPPAPGGGGAPPPMPSRDNRLSVGPGGLGGLANTLGGGGGAPPPMPSRDQRSMSAAPPPMPARGGPSGSPGLPPRGPAGFGGDGGGFNPQGAVDNAAAQARGHAQREAGKAAAGAAMDTKNQEAMGNYIAQNSDNKLVGAVAQNKWVQQKAGAYAAEKAQDEQFQQQMGDAAIKGAKTGGKAGFNAAKNNSSSINPKSFGF
jgi:hypothetical protein